MNHTVVTRSWPFILSASLGLLLSILGSVPAIAEVRPDDLEAGFQRPPAAARPLVFWQWMNGWVTKAGITSDLESFKRVGLAGVQNFQVGGSESVLSNPDVRILDPAWREMMRFAENECARLGLDFGTHNCPGWSSSGGPWMSAADSMQKLVWTETTVAGPRPFGGRLARPAVDPRWNYFGDIVVLAYPASGDIVPNDVLDLTSRMSADGTLEWQAPPGTWIVARFGHTTTGQINGTAPESGQGLECDKMSRKAVDAFWAAYPAKLLADAAGNRSFTRLEIDSYEAGPQDWTPEMRAEFSRRRGYDLLHWLPVLCGRIVGGPEASARFRWDLKRTISDLFSENYYDYVAQLAHRTPGLKLVIEPYATGRVEPFDGPAASDGDDTLACEFWAKPCPWGWDSVKPVTSSAHIDGKPVILGESFTGQPQYAWKVDPYALKSTGDRAFCLGVNRLILHAAAQQPWPGLRPGMTMGWWGTQFGPGQTWWEHGGPEWIAYLARCQYLLQTGTVTADLCYLSAGRMTPILPAGYDGDTCGERELMTQLRLSNGELVGAGGAHYRLLVLPESNAMLPAVARRIRELVRGGAAVAGPRPDHSPSLQDWPSSDNEVARIGREIWGECDGTTVKERRFGRGRVFWGDSPEQILATLGVAPDVIQPEGSSLLWIHHSTESAQFYFLSNQADVPVTVDVSFRVEDRVPELWHPNSGTCTLAPGWSSGGHRTVVPLRMDPSGSVFVVFRKLRSRDDVRSDLAVAPDVADERLSSIPLAGPWEVQFPAGSGAPPRVLLDQLASWTENADEGVRYFSGTATYRKSFELAPGLLAPGRSVVLDLGRVKNIAEIRLNGVHFNALWKPPFQTNVTGALHAGHNVLEIDLTNLWPNRLIGDEQQPDDCEWGPVRTFGYVDPPAAVGRPLVRVPDWILESKPRPAEGRWAFTTFKFFSKDSALLESGLLGPVELRWSPGPPP